MPLGDVLRFSVQALRANKVRTFLTALGLVIGNASVILVVTISLTSRDYILEQIRGIGSNLVYAYYESGGQDATVVEADYVKMADVEAVRQQLASRIVAATGVMTSFDRMLIEGRERDVRIIGSDEFYHVVRNLQLLAGRFLDGSDVQLRQKVALLTESLAARLYGNQAAAIGQVLKIHGLQFTVIGTFKERTSTFGLSELSNETVLIPISVLRYFVRVERIDPMYVQVRRSGDVEAVAGVVKQILESRHRPGAGYKVETLTAILEAANRIALVLTLVLIMVSAIALIISGIGIMNIMLVTVTERTREIGVRMAVGASRKAVLQQFLAEAILISVAGGFAGIVVGVGIPLSVRFLAEGVAVPISATAIVVAFAVSLLVGLVFGMLPANRASRLNPTEALRYE
ncbi:MAG: ABC transporter permease [Bryobacteraceae bacterium]|nr:ABC transporter permease [Bryobacterales bacterium]MEB2360400.1 ABC transporter permease [Bryobacterales bacterium]NUN00718.1 ABC transporter permease [Bryobacteraceae bacterium]